METKIFQQLSKIQKLTSLILFRKDLSLYSELKECLNETEERKEYAYILCVNGKIKKPLAVSWWSTEKQMRQTKADMHAAAYAFKKTASIIVYEKKNRIEWKYVESCNLSNFCYIPQEITITADNKIFYEE